MATIKAKSYLEGCKCIISNFIIFQLLKLHECVLDPLMMPQEQGKENRHLT